MYPDQPPYRKPGRRSEWNRTFGQHCCHIKAGPYKLARVFGEEYNLSIRQIKTLARKKAVNLVVVNRRGYVRINPTLADEGIDFQDLIT